MPFKVTFALIFLLALGRLIAQPSLLVTEAPFHVAPNSNVEITTKILDSSIQVNSCQLKYSIQPRGDQITGHTLALEKFDYSGAGNSHTITFKPSDLDTNGIMQMSVGLKYIIMVCTDNNPAFRYYSNEVTLQVETPTTPKILSPKVTTTKSSPTLSWSPVTGVAAYHVLISDRPIDLSGVDESSEEGEAPPLDISALWQAITPQTTIQYGSTDPSGSFSAFAAPPLSPGTRYYLYVFNNYSGSGPSFTKFGTFDVSIFSVENSDTLGITRPQNLYPVAEDVLSSQENETISLRWTSGGSKVNLYQVFVYAQESQRDSDAKILLPIWQNSTTDTTASFRANEILSNKKYYYQVFAQNSNGFSLAGDTTAFYYSSDLQEVIFQTNTLYKNTNSVDTLNLGNVSLNIKSLDGHSDIIPVTTLPNGSFRRSLVPGEYEFIFQKNGYIPLSLKKTINLDTSRNANTISVFLIKRQEGITGAIFSEEDTPIFGAQISAIDNFSKVYTTLTNGLGQFELGLPEGEYQLSVTHPQFQPHEEPSIRVMRATKFYTGNLVLKRINTYLSGNVTNEAGVTLSGAQIMVIDTFNNEHEALTDNNGYFSIPLKLGAYQIFISKPGFGFVQKTVEIISSQYLNIQLNSGATIINGRVNSLIQLEQTTTTTPYAGAELTLTHLKTNQSLRAQSNSTGDFSFSFSEQGDYHLIAQSPEAISDTLLLRVDESTKTINTSLNLTLYAQIDGIVEFFSEKPIDFDNLTLHLVSKTKGEIIQSVHVNHRDNNIHYTFNGIPDGNYQISGGMPGYGLLESSSVTITDNTWISGPTLTFFKSDKSFKYSFSSGPLSLEGEIHTLKPYGFIHNVLDTLKNAPYGEYIQSYFPSERQYIPIEYKTFSLDTSSTPTQFINYEFPFKHTTPPLNVSDDSLSISFTQNEGVSIDSAFIVYGFRGNQDTSRFIISDALKQQITIYPGPDGGTLKYFFVIYGDSLRYSNASPNQNFQFQIEPSSSLHLIDFNKPSTVNILQNVPLNITANGYDISGENLKSKIEASGKVKWSSSHKNLKITHSDSLTCSVLLSKTSEKKFSVTADISLGNIKLTKKIQLYKVTGELNAISISASSGTRVDLTPNTPLEIFTTGMDTTVSPPKIIEGIIQLSVSPPNAGTFMGNRLHFNPDFIGPARIVAEHIYKDKIITSELGGDRDSLLRGVNVGQNLSGEKKSRVFIHDQALRIYIPGSSIISGSSGLLKLYRKEISNGFTSTKDFELEGSLYEIANPGGIQFTKFPRLQFLLEGSQLPEFSMVGEFDESSLKWNIIPDSLLTDSTLDSGDPLMEFRFKNFAGYYYGILNPSRPLSVSDFSITPNPFSPLVLAKRDGNTEYGARINFVPHSNESDQVTISLQIFNTKGELIRVLEKFKSVPKTNQTYYWDGKTDSGRWARNGRYFVMLLIKETINQKTKKFLKPIVLFK